MRFLNIFIHNISCNFIAKDVPYVGRNILPMHGVERDMKRRGLMPYVGRKCRVSNFKH